MKKGPLKRKKSVELIPEEQLKFLGERIRSLRISAGYSSYETFAYENEISRSQYIRYENGKDIRFSTLIRIITALGVSVEEFFSEGFTSKQ